MARAFESTYYPEEDKIASYKELMESYNQLSSFVENTVKIVNLFQYNTQIDILF